MQSDRIKLVEFIDTQIKTTEQKIKESEKALNSTLKVAYGVGYRDALKYMKKCLKDSSPLDKE